MICDKIQPKRALDSNKSKKKKPKNFKKRKKNPSF